MIKYFQKLQAKKGFTLVELIVVIAIIGVLAAILIPTMLGYVTSSRVTSANSTAASIKNSIDNFLTDADTQGFGMKQSKTAHCGLKINVDSSGWNITVTNSMKADDEADDAFKSSKDVSWSTNPATVSFDASRGSSAVAGKAEALLALQLKDLFPEIKSACIAAYLEGGKCMYVAYTADCSSWTNGPDMPGKDAFSDKICSWNGQTAGVSANGYIIGTAPACALGDKNATQDDIVG